MHLSVPKNLLECIQNFTVKSCSHSKFQLVIASLHRIPINYFIKSVFIKQDKNCQLLWQKLLVFVGQLQALYFYKAYCLI